MSAGIKPYDFVQQVYYAQEKVLLDFWPTDDKYKEVITEANFVIQELQKEEDWNWLRESVVLGETTGKGINTFVYDDEAYYKPATLYQDSVRLYLKDKDGKPIPSHYIRVPLISGGSRYSVRNMEFDGLSIVNTPNLALKAVQYGNQITFNRPFTPFEQNRIAVTDLIMRMPLLHVCNDNCKAATASPDDPTDFTPSYTDDDDRPCSKIEKKVFTEIPDPYYMVIRTAALHAEGSPSAQGRLASLQDQALKMLSGMRESNAAATDSDYIEWDVPGFLDII